VTAVGFGQGTFAGTRRNGQDAPIPDVRGNLIEASPGDLPTSPMVAVFAPNPVPAEAPDRMTAALRALLIRE
jgi:hypothetical protein